MRFYNQRHRHYCGIDLHTRMMYLCIVDADGQVLLHRNMPASREPFLQAIAPFRDDLVVAVECIFTWYWLADLCAAEQIPFILGHALYMKAIHGGKAKNDRIDSQKIAGLLRSGMIPMAYVYPAKMRATRDLLRRRMTLMRRRAELIAHIQIPKFQYNRPDFQKKIIDRRNRDEVIDHFPDPVVQKNVEADLAVTAELDRILNELELYIVRHAKEHDAFAFHLLRSIPGIGKILALVILYEVHDVERFPTVQQFASYARLVKCPKESAGKRYGYSGAKIGNAHLKWAFSEAAVLFLRNNPEGMRYKKRLETKHGKGKALSILAHRIGRTAYFVLKTRKPFEKERFLAA